MYWKMTIFLQSSSSVVLKEDDINHYFLWEKYQF